jgi:hypothetical protein
MSIKTAAFKHSNGDILRDKVTGFEGVVRVRAEYSTGCLHYGLQSQKLNEKGEPGDWQWIDQSQLVLVESGAVEFTIDEDSISGPMPSGPQA